MTHAFVAPNDFLSFVPWRTVSWTDSGHSSRFLTQDAVAPPLTASPAILSETAPPRRRLVMPKSHGSPRIKETAGKLIQLLTLRTGWDSYSARPIDPQNVFAALDLTLRVMERDTPTPHVVPRVGGGLQLEWHMNNIDLEIYVAVPNVSFFAADAAAETGDDCPLPASMGELKGWIHRLSNSERVD